MPSAADRLLLGVARRAPRWTAVLAAAVDAALHRGGPATALARLAALLAVMAAADVLAPLAAAGYEASSTAWLRRRLLDRALALTRPPPPRSCPTCSRPPWRCSPEPGRWWRWRCWTGRWRSRSWPAWCR